MSTYASPLSNGKTSPRGFLRVFSKLLTGSGVIEPTALAVSAQTTPDMTVKVSGSALNDNAVFIHTDGTFVQAWNDASANVAIATNTSGVVKTDAIVAYVDLADFDATNPDNPGSLKFIAVRRSGALTGAPATSDITGSAVGSNPYIVLAHVTVASGLGSSPGDAINSGNIADQRPFARFEADRLEPIGSSQIADDAVTVAKIASGAVTKTKAPTLLSAVTTGDNGITTNLKVQIHASSSVPWNGIGSGITQEHSVTFTELGKVHYAVAMPMTGNAGQVTEQLNFTVKIRPSSNVVAFVVKNLGPNTVFSNYWTVMAIGEAP